MIAPPVNGLLPPKTIQNFFPPLSSIFQRYGAFLAFVRGPRRVLLIRFRDMPLSFIHGPLLMLAASSLLRVIAREKVILLIGHDFSRRRALGVSASHLPPMMVPNLITLLLIDGLGGRSIGSGRTNRRRRRRRVAFRVYCFKNKNTYNRYETNRPVQHHLYLTLLFKTAVSPYVGVKYPNNISTHHQQAMDQHLATM